MTVNYIAYQYHAPRSRVNPEAVAQVRHRGARLHVAPRRRLAAPVRRANDPQCTKLCRVGTHTRMHSRIEDECPDH